MRACGRCGQSRPERAFRVYRKFRAGRVETFLQVWCYDCEKEYGRLYYYLHREDTNGEAKDASQAAPTG